eukprot:scaffold49017_cov281-Isochrysis_galbana.AAC.3
MLAILVLVLVRLDARQPHSQAFTQSTPSRQSGMVQPVVQEMLATVHAAGSGCGEADQGQGQTQGTYMGMGKPDRNACALALACAGVVAGAAAGASTQGDTCICICVCMSYTVYCVKTLRGFLMWRVPTDGWHRSPTHGRPYGYPMYPMAARCEALPSTHLSGIQ